MESFVIKVLTLLLLLPTLSTAVPFKSQRNTLLDKRERLSPRSLASGSTGLPKLNQGKKSTLGPDVGLSLGGKNSSSNAGSDLLTSGNSSSNAGNDLLTSGNSSSNAGSDLLTSSLTGSQNQSPSGLNNSSPVVNSTELPTSSAPSLVSLGANNDSTTTALNSLPPGQTSTDTTSVTSLQLLQNILNSTLESLPGLQSLASEVQQLLQAQTDDVIQMGQNSPEQPGSRTKIKSGIQESVNATTNNTISVKGEVAMNGTDSQGRACETYGYITLSATTLTTLSGFFESLVKLEKTISDDGSKRSARLIQKARAQVSFTMLSVVKLTATPAVTSCHVAPSETTFSSVIQGNVTLCAKTITQLEQDLKSGTTSASQSSELGTGETLSANSTLNQTIGSSGNPPNYLGPTNGSDLPLSGDPSTPPYNSSLSGGLSAPLYNSSTSGGLSAPLYNSSASGGLSAPLYNSSASGGLSAPLYNSSASGGLSTPPYNSSLSGDISSAPYNDPPSGDISTLPYNNGGSSTQSVSIQQFSEVKASFAAVAHVTTGLIASQPSQGAQGIHLGVTSTAQVNVDIKARVAVHSTVIDNFLDRVNDGSGAQDHQAASNSEIQDKDGMGILAEISGSMSSTFLNSLSFSGSGSSQIGSIGQNSGTTDIYNHFNPGFGGGSNTHPQGEITSAVETPGSSGESRTAGASSNNGISGLGGAAMGTSGLGESQNATTPGGGSSGYPTSNNGISGLGGAGMGPSGLGESQNATTPGGGSSEYPTGLSGLGGTSGTSGGSGYSTSGNPTSTDPNSGGFGSSGSSRTSGPFGLLPVGSNPGLTGGGGSANNCICNPDSSTHLRIRSLEDQLDHVHRIMHKRGLTEL